MFAPLLVFVLGAAPPGAQATEVAFLLRKLKNRFARDRDHTGACARAQLPPPE